MSVKGPIIIIEDDPDDSELLAVIFKELGIKNEQLYFETCPPVLEYLLTTTDKPFIILSDVNLPGMNGTELKEKISANEFLRKKSIPFIFYTTTAKAEAVSRAYDMMVQGYFEKPVTKDQMKETIKLICDYWRICLHPNSSE